MSPTSSSRVRVYLMGEYHSDIGPDQTGFNIESDLIAYIVLYTYIKLPNGNRNIDGFPLGQLLKYASGLLPEPEASFLSGCLFVGSSRSWSSDTSDMKSESMGTAVDGLVSFSSGPWKTDDAIH